MVKGGVGVGGAGGSGSVGGVGAGVVGGVPLASPMEAEDMLYEYFPLSLDDWYVPLLFFFCLVVMLVGFGVWGFGGVVMGCWVGNWGGAEDGEMGLVERGLASGKGVGKEG